MKNDFDFIREKFDSDGVNAPDGINEDLVLSELEGVEPVKPKKKKTSMVLGITSAAVASVAVITAAAFLAVNLLGKLPVRSIGTPVSVSGSAKLLQFNSRDEVKKAVGNAMKFRENLYSGERYNVLDGDVLEYGAEEKLNSDSYSAGSANGSASGSSGGSSSHNSTYVQHTGVDEADCVKTDSEYIYYLAPASNGMKNQIQIYRAARNDTERVSEITELNDEHFREFYVYGDRLVVLADDNRKNTSTAASVYDISDRSKPKLIDSFSQSGRYISSRMIDGTLYMVSDYYVYDDGDIPETGNSGATPDEVPANCIYSVETPADSSFLVVSSVDTQNGAKVLNTKSILGSADDIYCNQDYLYVNATEYEAKYYNRILSNSFAGNYYAPTEVKTQIVKFSLNDDLDAVASCCVNGEINNQYSLDEHNGNLRVATTSINGKNSFEVNNLYVLDPELNQIGAVEGFAKDESIKAVRYMGDTAYVITYEETDPLFVIDLTNPSDPTILGEVKISGFSTMLVPIDENTVLGIGYNTGNVYYTDMEVQNGMKIVTFDVSDKKNPKVLDTKVFEDYYSEVQYNPKALLVNTERNDFTIPFYGSGDGYSGYDSFSGIINFKVEDGKINIVDEYRSEVFEKNNNAEVSRCVYIGNTIYMLGTTWQDIDYTIDYSADKYYDGYYLPTCSTAIDWVDYK